MDHSSSLKKSKSWPHGLKPKYPNLQLMKRSETSDLCPDRNYNPKNPENDPKLSPASSIEGDLKVELDQASYEERCTERENLKPKLELRHLRKEEDEKELVTEFKRLTCYFDTSSEEEEFPYFIKFDYARKGPSKFRSRFLGLGRGRPVGEKESSSCDSWVGEQDG